jgi:predicted phage tail protein
MARIAIVVAAVAAGVAISVATGGLGTAAGASVASEIIAGASVGLAVGNTINAVAFRDHTALNQPIQDLQVSSSADGSPIPIPYGENRYGGQIIWAPDIKFTQHQETAGGGGS